VFITSLNSFVIVNTTLGRAKQQHTPTQRSSCSWDGQGHVKTPGLTADAPR
jgi:hypothetical protein